MLTAPRTLDEFYSAVMAENGIKLAEDQVEKVAAARGEDPVRAKIAKAIYDQTLVDCLDYASSAERKSDAFKMAEAYIKHIEESKTAATKVASDLLRIASFAVEGYLAQNGISALTALDGVKIAAAESDGKGSDFVMQMMRDKEEKKEVAEEKDEKKEEKDEKKDEK
jgi:hypothetical protein